jgi:hypothetical protein
MPTMAPPDIDLDAMRAAILTTASPEPAPRIARRVTMTEAKAHFDAGGDVLVSEHGQASVTVGPSSTVHNFRTTTWKELREQVASWRTRYPNQRYYIVPDGPGEALLARAEVLGRQAYAQDRPAAPAACPEVVEMVRGWDVGEGAAAVFAAFGRGYTAAGDQAAAEAVRGRPAQQAKAERIEEEHDTLTAAIWTALNKVYEGESKTAVERRKKIWDAIVAELGEIEAYGLDLGGRVPIGDAIELGNAYIEVDGFGNLVTVTVTEGGMPIWDRP